MFTEYHLEKIIQAINDAEERQTKAIVAAIEKLKPEPVKVTQERHDIELAINPDLFTPEEERFGGKIEPIERPDVLGEEDAVKRMKVSLNKAREQKKTSAAKKPTATKKPAPVRGRN